MHDNVIFGIVGNFSLREKYEEYLYRIKRGMKVSKCRLCGKKHIWKKAK